jgi:hypothetical protein
MRVKIGDDWHAVELGKPIMIELTKADRRNIAAMLPDATKYAAFDDREPLSSDEKLAWMAS